MDLFPCELVQWLRSCSCLVFVVSTRSAMEKILYAQHIVDHMKQRRSPHFTLLTRAHFRLDADQITQYPNRSEQETILPYI